MPYFIVPTLRRGNDFNLTHSRSSWAYTTGASVDHRWKYQGIIFVAEYPYAFAPYKAA
jgi:hypothetical protein